MFSPQDVGGWICLGSYKTAWRRLKRWQDEGVWYRIFRALASIREHGMVSVDSSTVEAKKGGASRI
jgi:transposase